MGSIIESGEAKKMRLQIGCDILVMMQERDDLPLPNIYRVAKTMQEYFWVEGFEDSLKDLGYQWRPKPDYWRVHMPEIREFLRKSEGVFFEFMRGDSGFKGEWLFVDKEQFEQIMGREAKENGSRIGTYTDRAEVGAEVLESHTPILQLVHG